MKLLTELNNQANFVTDELIKAKRAAKSGKGVAAAYQQGRAEELEKWLHSLEDLIKKILEAREKAKIEKEAQK